jgi:hypothetical protein
LSALGYLLCVRRFQRDKHDKTTNNIKQAFFVSCEQLIINAFRYFL